MASLQRHWFMFLLPLLLALQWALFNAEVSRLALYGLLSAPRVEAGVLLINCAVLPLCFYACYPRPMRRSIIRCVALACFGTWFCSALVAPENQHVLPALVVFRYVGIGVLLIVEFRFLLLIIRSVVADDDPSQDHLVERLVQEGDYPLWYARLMAFEASLWKRLYRFMKPERKP